jgi:hypothetical protein
MENIGSTNLGPGGKTSSKKKGPLVKIGYEDEEEDELEYEYEDETRVGNRNKKEMIKATAASTGAANASFGEAARKR